MVFLTVLPTLGLSPGGESLECMLYYEPQTPWSELAFPTITHIRIFYGDRKENDPELYFGDIAREKPRAVLTLHKGGRAGAR